METSSAGRSSAEASSARRNATRATVSSLALLTCGCSKVRLVCVGKLSYEIRLELEDGSVG
jgi:hypothetical protein